MSAMTKTEARKWLRRIRKDVQLAEKALTDGNLEDFLSATEDGSGSFGELNSAASGDGFAHTSIRGLL